jgi:hypothetical protein
LSEKELAWINDYHVWVRRALRPQLGEQDSQWLEQATVAIGPLPPYLIGGVD